MNKEEVRDLFQDPLAELDEFAKEIQKIKDLINLIIENFDLLKDDVTDDQVGEVSSEINFKVSKIIALIKDIMSDSKKLEAFINEIKLLKRKREKKLNKSKKDIDFDELMKELEKLKKTPNPLNPWQPNNPWSPPSSPPPNNPWLAPNTPYISPYTDPDWKITF